MLLVRLKFNAIRIGSTDWFETATGIESDGDDEFYSIQDGQKVLAADADPTNMKDEVDYVVVEYEDFVTVSIERGLPSLSLAELKNMRCSEINLKELLQSNFYIANKSPHV
ncbi:hypothetical protein L1987_01722 [Smallanthus sonchifolius]|uniref:Uncharacterized protein n=1 Tax=Smallanthus sonchifolius TaxID=185202 RepID=A0ACB9K5U9_9ASTR|nr:hypothetical protein L1987_01722 [Smallanthus sonchifolius]